MTNCRWLQIAFLGLMLLLSMNVGCQEEEERTEGTEDHTQEPNNAEERITLSETALKMVSIETTAVQRHNLVHALQTTATIEPNAYRLAKVSPRIPGRVIAVKALLGDTVKEGQILAELDSLELGQAKAEYLTAKTNVEVAQTNYQREERLFKQKISSEKAYLDARGVFLRADTQYKATREALRLLDLADQEIKRLAWGQGQRSLSHFPLLAPFTGTVVEHDITLGELLQFGDTPYVIADLSTLWVQLDIYEKDLGRLRSGVPVRLSVDAYPQESFQGTVTYLSDLLDETTRTAQARVEIPNPERKLRPGMFAAATVLMPVPDAAEVLAIPATAVQRVRERPVAFVQEAEGVFVLRPLKVGHDSGPYIEVLGGLSDGEQVVVEGGFYLKSTVLKEEIGEDE